MVQLDPEIVQMSEIGRILNSHLENSAGIMDFFSVFNIVKESQIVSIG